MTKILSLVSLAAITVTLQAQTPASPPNPDPAAQTGQTRDGEMGATPQAQVQAASLSAELTKSIDTKRSKVGDPVNAKTMNEARLPDGTDLPKGTKLVGNVVDVTPKAKEQKNSHLVLAINRVVLKDGQEVPIRSAVTSVTAPASNPGGGGMGSMPSGGATPSGGSANSGGASSGASSAPAPGAPAMSANTGEGSQSVQGGMLKSAQDRVPVGNLQNVILSAPTTPESTGILDGAGKNFSLDSGTTLTLNIIPARPGAQGQ